MVIINSFIYPESNIRFQRRNVRVFLDKKDIGLGQLYISENNIAWQQNENQGFTVPYTHITLHGISKDENICQKECIYMITDEELTLPGEQPQENSDNSDDEAISVAISELVLVPEGEEGSLTEIVKSMYDTIKLCQEMNPDPDDMEDDEEDDHLYEDAEGEMYDEENDVSERGGGDADVNDLSRRIEHNSLNVCYDYTNGTANDDEDFQDAD